MTPTLPSLAADLARRLKLHQCNPVEIGSWPRFADTKAHPVRECLDCRAIKAYEAYVAIVQLPAAPSVQVPEKGAG